MQTQGQESRSPLTPPPMESAEEYRRFLQSEGMPEEGIAHALETFNASRKAKGEGGVATADSMVPPSEEAGSDGGRSIKISRGLKRIRERVGSIGEPAENAGIMKPGEAYDATRAAQGVATPGTELSPDAQARRDKLDEELDRVKAKADDRYSPRPGDTPAQAPAPIPLEEGASLPPIPGSHPQGPIDAEQLQRNLPPPPADTMH